MASNSSIVIAAFGNVAKYATGGLIFDRSEAVAFWSRLIAVAGKWYGKDRWVPTPRTSLNRLYPAIDTESVQINLDNFSNGDVSNYELFLLCLLAKHVKAKAIFEIGTFLGATTFNLALSNPAAKIYTLDLPTKDALSKEILDTELHLVEASTAAHGRKRFHGTPQAEQITELFGDSLEFDYSPFYGKIDFVFIDAAHDYLHVVADTENALKLLSPSGVIVWHDFGRGGVTQCVEEFAKRLCPQKGEIVQVEGTCLALYRR
jgi:predicted O-methyltransferase YrrM